MSRRHIQFACETEQLLGTLDDAPGTTGLLMVTGGNETRAGAFSGQAQLAARIASAGHPVFRFDRRGVGDSSGKNGGFRESGRDIAAGFAAFFQERPDMTRVVGFGNCDAASALMLFSGGGCHSLVLANPWTFEEDDGALPPEAIRARYAEKLRNPRELLRLLGGKVSISKLAGGVLRAMRPAPPPTNLAQEIASGLEAFDGPARILLAGRDRTARAFLGVWNADDPRLSIRPDADHAFSDQGSRDWLFAHLLEALA
ncbi:exosortase A-associated hydrolase 1 [Altererythrobacter atlanticus]|uniref:Alpha/beta hydrolase family protein n=1 Tax=Croceibacterium atlanticum TaxID=1267766 RepID=A0A0F7KQ99_9SPHN|nr:hydrolase 1, exosortase A system-associated [Croceibacterium atlanticum]AKH41724.1 Alpha/beta hydrolase family protein [Croceibacterium atlanticum]MBB5733188.1 exosortase A-associated hydrolase 1 [Croceibacterium atlanticum]